MHRNLYALCNYMNTDIKGIFIAGRVNLKLENK